MKYAESNKVELKEKLKDDSVKRAILAFLNTEGGTIYVGVTDEGRPLPCFDPKERDEMEQVLANWIRDCFYPDVFGLIRHRFNEDGVLVLEVLEGLDKPYYLKEKGPKPSGVYVRIGTSSRMASESEILLMLLDSREFSYEKDVSQEQELTFRSFQEICQLNKVACEERSWRSLRMVNRDGKFTNLGFLLSDQSDLVVKFAKYDKEMNFKVKKEFKGPLLDVLNDVLEKAEDYNDISAVIPANSWQRKETSSYPGASLREGILNAFCHSDYFIHSNIKIEFFDDRVRIVNPGGIYQATLEQILSGIQTYRNPGLVNILNKLHYIENFGTGIPRIFRAYRGFGKRPEFEPNGHFFILSLPNLHFRDLITDPVNPINDLINDPITEPVNEPTKDLLKCSNIAIDGRDDGAFCRKSLDADPLTDPVNDPVNPINDLINDPITEPVNEPPAALRTDSKKSGVLNDFDFAVLKLIESNPGINISGLQKSLNEKYPSATVSRIKNTLKRKLAQYVLFRGPFRSGGYFFEDQTHKNK